MDVPARLKWRKESGRFVAYPVGLGNKGRYASVQIDLSSVTTQSPPSQADSWRWSAVWDGWFSNSGYADSKQKAADLATEAWWRLVQTDIPLNVNLEAAMIVARVLVRPMPNSLLGEDTEFLQKVMSHLSIVYARELRDEALPGRVEAMMARLSEQLFSRRQSAVEAR